MRLLALLLFAGAALMGCDDLLSGEVEPIGVPEAAPLDDEDTGVEPGDYQ